MEKASIYIHYPYCISKCHYCDFISFPCKNIKRENLEEYYIKELGLFKNFIGKREISSIYFGGGTPSLMELGTLEKILKSIEEIWGIKEDIEITIEVNPKTITKEQLKTYKSLKINRISIGLQSLRDDNLRFLGRIHTKEEGLESLENIRNYFDNVNADFIYALPNQKMKDWEEELKEIKKLDLKHLSLYELIIEDNTKLSKMLKNGEIEELNEAKRAKMYELTNDYLKGDIERYEISNYAKKGYESKHNMNYWEGGDYIGIGVSSASRLKRKGKFYIKEDEKEIPKWKEEILKGNMNMKMLKEEERAEELIIMGLRKIEGINIKKFEEIIGKHIYEYIDENKVNILIKEKKLKKEKEYLKATNEGLLLLDRIIYEIIK